MSNLVGKPVRVTLAGIGVDGNPVLIPVTGEVRAVAAATRQPDPGQPRPWDLLVGVACPGGQQLITIDASATVDRDGVSESAVTVLDSPEDGPDRNVVDANRIAALEARIAELDDENASLTAQNRALTARINNAQLRDALKDRS